MLAEAKGGSASVEGVAEVKSLKERSRLLMDVWVRLFSPFEFNMMAEKG